MDKNELKGIMRRTADNMADLLTRPDRSTKRRRQFAKMGYKLLRITVTDADTGEVVTHRETYRKQEDLKQFQGDIVKLAMWPDELLDEVSWGILDLPNADMVEVTPVKKILKKQGLSDGRPKGISKRTAARYEQIMRDYEKCKLSPEQFCSRNGLTMQIYYRAYNFKHGKKSK